MYCHNFHLVLSDADFSFVISVMSIGSSHTWWTCAPILFPFFTGSSSTLIGMWACIQLSLVGLLVLSSRHLCDMSWLGVLWLILFFSIFLFGLENTLYSLCIMMRLFTLDGCGDYRQVWCVTFFSKTSILVVSSGPHQWIQLVDRT